MIGRLNSKCCTTRVGIPSFAFAVNADLKWYHVNECYYFKIPVISLIDLFMKYNFIRERITYKLICNDDSESIRLM
jgi:hypothetical protein